MGDLVYTVPAPVHQIGTWSVNFSCPAETLKSFVSGTCLWYDRFGLPLHNGITYTGPQLDAVLEFLRRDGDRVGAVAIMLGGNDLVELIAWCVGALR